MSRNQTVASLFTGGGLFEAAAMAIEFQPEKPDLGKAVANCKRLQLFGSFLEVN